MRLVPLLAAVSLPFLVAASPVDVPIALAQTNVGAAERSDFGLGALQRTKQSYVAGDAAAARRNLTEATDILMTKAGSMQAPGRGEVWMLVNDLRLIRLVEGGTNPATLHSLTEAEARASALAGRHPERSAPPAASRN
jgi:hypothetical protein